MKWLFFLFILLSLTACSTQVYDSFTMNYTSRYTSSSGERILDIQYTVVEGEITSCTGKYHYPGPIQINRLPQYENCSVEKLASGRYGEVPRNITEDKLVNSYAQGPYQWSYFVIDFS